MIKAKINVSHSVSLIGNNRRTKLRRKIERRKLKLEVTFWVDLQTSLRPWSSAVPNLENHEVIKHE